MFIDGGKAIARVMIVICEAEVVTAAFVRECNKWDVRVVV